MTLPKAHLVSLRSLSGLVLMAMAAMLMFSKACQAMTIGQIADVSEERPNQLIGFGLVVGLNGTGDTLEKSPFTSRSLQTELAKLGVQQHPQTQDTKDVATAMVTATIDPLNGDKIIDVNVSAVGDATNIIGGRLIPTALIGADSMVYVVAAGTVDLVDSRPGAERLRHRIALPTSGRIIGGGSLEQTGQGPGGSTRLHLTLRAPDLETAMCVAAAINANHAGIASAHGAGLVLVKPPASTQLKAFVKDLKQINFASDGSCAKTPGARGA